MRDDRPSRRRVLFVSPHFPPDSSAGSHRARILAPHLARHGWEPVVLTVEPSAIDGTPDSDLLAALPSHLRVIRAATTPVSRARAAGLGDLGLRALRGLYAEGQRLLLRESFDAVLITTYPIYPAWLGPRFKAVSGVPFVLDVQDPWVGAWGRTVGPGGRPDLRSRLSRRVAVALERSIAPRADALLSVSARTLEELAMRVPTTAHRPMLELPIGWEPADFCRFDTPSPHPRAERDALRLAYVGTLLPAGHDVVRAFLLAAEALLREPGACRIDLRFVGTSNRSAYDGPPVMKELVPRSLAGAVHEHPERLPYFEALRTLCSADVVLVFGTREPHYTSSKLYPALASGRPVLAVLHEDSQAAAAVKHAAGSVLVSFDATTPERELVRRALTGLRDVLALARSGSRFDRSRVLDEFRGDRLAGRLAGLLESVALGVRAEAGA